MYDTPAEVAEAFLSSLTETIESVDAEDGHRPGRRRRAAGGRREGRRGLTVWAHAGEQQKRKIVLDPSGSMNIYLVLDGSDSIGARNFSGAKNCLRAFVEKVEPPSSAGTLTG